MKTIHIKYLFPIAQRLLLLVLVFVAQAGFAQITSGVWTQVAPSNESRTEPMTAEVDGKIYSFGGFYMEWGLTQGAEVYDPATNTWTAIPSMPEKVTHPGVVVIDKSVWIIGGFGYNYTKEIRDKVLIYNTLTKTWSYGPTLPVKSGSCMAAKLGRKIHLIGGLKEDRQTNVDRHLVYDLDNPGAGWQTAAPLLNARNHLSGAAIGGKIYALGGAFGHDGPKTDVAICEAYDPYTNTWTRIADIPKTMSHFEPGTTVRDGKIIIAGGRTGGSGYINNVYEYNPASNTWATLDPLPAKVLAPMAKVVGDKLYTANGSSNGICLKTAWNRTMTRTVGDKLGFWPQALNLSMSSGTSQAKELYLWTVTNPTAYTINTSSLPAWLSLSKSSGTTNVQGDNFKITVNTAGLVKGTYTANIVASAPGYANVQLPVQVIVDGATGTNQPPMVSAGGNKTITLPTNSLTLTGSASDPDGSIATLLWAKQSGPAATMGGTNTTTLSLSNLVEGTYVFRLTATDNSGASAFSEATVTVNPQAATQAITSLSLINTVTNQVVGTLSNGYVINYATLGTQNITFRANTNPATVGSVVFNLDNGAVVKNENIAPYAFFGDNGSTTSLKYNPINPPLSVGSHTITVTPYASASGSGTKGTAITISFSVANSAARMEATGETTTNISDVADGFTQLKAYPNPFSESLTVICGFVKAEHVVVEVFDGKGILVDKLWKGDVVAGQALHLTFNGQKLPAGVYHCRLSTSSCTQHQKLLLLK